MTLSAPYYLPLDQLFDAMDEVHAKKLRAKQLLEQAQRDYEDAVRQELEAWQVYAKRLKAEQMKEQP